MKLVVAFLAVVCVVLSAHVAMVSATYGLDISAPMSLGTAQCLRNAGFEFAIVRGWTEGGYVDSAVFESVPNLWSAGFAHVDVYFFPCPKCGNAAGQVNSAVSSWRSRGLRFGMMWFDIEPSSWEDCDYNFNFLQEAVNEARSLGVNFGIYSSNWGWSQVMCGRSGFQDIPLWYAHWDNTPSFNDFQPFGGWSHPAMKQIVGDATVCGFDIDEDFY